MGDRDFVLSYFALYIFEGINVNLSFLVIMNSTQIGLLFINLDTCFYQIVDLDILYNNDTFVYMEQNIALITGYDIYAGHAKECITIINSRHRFTNVKSLATFFMCFVLDPYTTHSVSSIK